MVKYQWMLGWLLLLTGCQTASKVTRQEHAPPTKSAYPQVERDTQPAHSVGKVAVVDSPSADITLASAQVSDRTVPEKSDSETSPLMTNSSVGLSQYISLGLAQNPDLVALRQSENVGSAALGVAQTYPFNPFVQVQATC